MHNINDNTATCEVMHRVQVVASDVVSFETLATYRECVSPEYMAMLRVSVKHGNE